MGCLWAVYGLDKVYHIRNNHSFRQTCSGKKLTWICGCSMQDSNIYHLVKGLGYVENKHSIFWVKNAERD